VLLLLVAAILPAQTGMKYVPANAPVVLSINLSNLDRKVDVAQLQQYDFYNAIIKKYSQLGLDEQHQAYYKSFMLTPEKLGYDVLEPFYFFVNKDGNTTFFTMVMKMGNPSLYESELTKLKGDNYATRLSQHDGYQLWQNAKETFAWNGEVVVNVWSTTTPAEPTGWDWNEAPADSTFEYEIDTLIYDQPAEEPAYEEEHSGWENIEQQAATKAWVEKVMKRRFLQAITANETFRSAIAQPSDLHLWLDYDFLTAESMKDLQNLGMPGGMGQYMNFLQSFMEIFYADTYLSMGLNFENGKMAMRSELFFNEEMKKLYQGMTDVKFNKKFLRYVKGGDQLFGYYYLNFNVAKTIEEGKTLIHKLLASTPGYGEMASDVLKIIGIFIDEQAIGRLVKGDMMLAVSGLQTIPVTQQTYEFDADFNFIAKDTTVMQTLPIFTLMASYGSEKDLMKFIDLGLHSSVLTREGRYFKMTIPNTGMHLYLALRQGMLILTNNRTLVQQNLDKGYENKRRLDKKHRKMLCDNSLVMFWDIPNTIRAVAGDEAESNIGAMGYLNMMGKEFESMQATSSKKVGNSIRGNVDFNFINKKTNSLEQMFRIINGIYIELLGGAKI
jgi:hypothetical protein